MACRAGYKGGYPPRGLLVICMPSKIIYIAGTTKRVSIVELARPLITVIASGDHRLALSLLSRANGRKPRIVVEVVINIGLNLLPAAETIALDTLRPIRLS